MTMSRDTPGKAQDLASRPRSRWGHIFRWGLLTMFAVGGLSGAVLAHRSGLWRGEEPFTKLPRVPVSRADLSTVLTASGRVESSHNTIISCELERLEIRSQGISSMSGGASTILTLVDEGTTVKKGDILCRLDSADYEE